MAIAAPLKGLATRPFVAMCAAAMLLPAILSFGAVMEACEKEKAETTTYYVIDEGCSEPKPMFIEYGPRNTTLVQQQAEQNTTAVAQNVEQQLWPDFGVYNDTYDGLSYFGGEDIISNFFSNIGPYLFLQCCQNIYQIILICIMSSFACVAVRRFKRH